MNRSESNILNLWIEIYVASLAVWGVSFSKNVTHRLTSRKCVPISSTQILSTTCRLDAGRSDSASNSSADDAVNIESLLLCSKLLSGFIGTGAR
jgi:hypothetical protein